MGLTEIIKDKTVFIDTAPLIYYIEDSNRSYSDVLDIFFEMNLKMQVQLMTSTISLLEVLVIPLKTNNTGLADKYKYLLCQSNTFKLWGMDVEISSKAAALRAKYRLKTPDAIQIATAICHFSDYFLTNDKQLKIVDELNVLILDEL
jgi:predicted nucleic acid-binding protein